MPPLHRVTMKASSAFARMLHIEAMSGIVLLIAAAIALIWANSPWAASYFATWHAPLALTLGPWTWSTDLHFFVNDVLMTIFFLVVGMEIRREMYNGALADVRQALLPIIAALGGVVVPALIYVALARGDAQLLNGWAIPTATDIAFAVGVLALLGKSIPGPLRIFLLALAIIDDIVAVLIIAFFYSGGLDYSGFGIALVGLVLVLLFNRMGVAAAWAYVVPGAILWLGLLHTGAHPTLAGVVLGLMTPVTMRPAQRHHLDVAEQALTRIRSHAQRGQFEVDVLHHELRIATTAQRDLLPPVFRLPAMLHPWVAFGVMPIFALANAGVQFGGMDLAATGPHTVFWGVLLALVLGKPLGVFLATFLAVKSGVSPLPEGINWRGVLLVGVLAGIGFTMAIFVGGLAFSDAALLSAAKLGILAASATAAIVGLVYGFIVRHKLND
ncbi:Na+/H+ antiporter NhaA [Comamonas kerstersii]|uniref:Na(+)/H(+) antiporter NhaA n=1 Tax=Comamonas kerstersii TaxID=225992 RepID=A0A0W7Z1U4_9BURK|nr:sodium:proton antiporter [Comamonas kerstersii]OOH86163.1 Na+/H+ antiporter NhaA [Comamonas kerstersii]OOH92916.1 Na+/H+ antiporter NhaA [Comamonas kerstersii]